MFYDLVSQSCHACPEPRALRSGGGKPLTRRLAALAVAAALMTGTAVPAFADVYDIRKGSITIVANGDGTAKVTQNETVNDKDDDVKVTGSNEVTGNTVDIINNTDNDLKVTLSDVTITDPKGDAAPVSVSGTGNTAIELDGSNTLKSSGWHAGLERNEEKNSDGNVVSGKLTIQDEDKNGSLDATGGFGGAGIGGANIKNSGALEITGGTITATGKQDGAGIGGGGSGGDGMVTISGGNITARGGSSDNPNAACGGGFGGNATVIITGDAVIEEATGGGACAGIGSGYYDAKTDITISGNAEVKNAQGGAQGAGIGGGGFRGTGTVTITDNAKVDNATGGEGAAGTGSGLVGNVTVNISGNATVNAEGGANGAGIGGGYASAGDVTIEGGTTVSAAGGVGGGAGSAAARIWQETRTPGTVSPSTATATAPRTCPLWAVPRSRVRTVKMPARAAQPSAAAHSYPQTRTLWKRMPTSPLRVRSPSLPLQARMALPLVQTAKRRLLTTCCRALPLTGGIPTARISLCRATKQQRKHPRQSLPATAVWMRSRA